MRPVNQQGGGTNRRIRGASDGQHHVVEYLEGPLPAPETLAQYDALVPGAANRIITMAEEQATHRRNLEAQAVPAAIAAEKRGQYSGLVVAISGLGASLILGLAGKEVAAAALGGGGLFSLAAVFVVGRRAQERERAANRGR